MPQKVIFALIVPFMTNYKKKAQESGESVPQDEEIKYAEHSRRAKEAIEEYKKDKDLEESRFFKIFTMDL